MEPTKGSFVPPCTSHRSNTQTVQWRDAHALLWVKLLFDLIICWWDDYYMALWGRKCLGATTGWSSGYWPVGGARVTPDPLQSSLPNQLAWLTTPRKPSFPLSYYYFWPLNIIQIVTDVKQQLATTTKGKKSNCFPRRRLFWWGKCDLDPRVAADISSDTTWSFSSFIFSGNTIYSSDDAFWFGIQNLPLLG